MTLKDLMYLLFAIIVLYFTQQYWRDDYKLDKFIDSTFFLGKRE